MANIYTKRSHYPRTTMANNYRPIITEGKLPKICRPQPRLLSPDRSLNPHPQGLSFQVPDGKAAFSIWNKDFEVIKQKLPLMLRYQRWVNFSAPFESDVPEVEFKRTREIPKMQFALNTTYRRSYQSPDVLPELKDKQKTGRFGNTPAMVVKPARGIVPEARAPQYSPYETH